jgi:hypothetical protein
MDHLREFSEEFKQTLESLPGGPKILGALLLLLLGWIVCKLFAAGMFRMLDRLDRGGRFSESLFGKGEGKPRDEHRFARIGSRVFFWLLFLFVFVGVFDVLELESVSEPLRELLGGVSIGVPGLLKAALIAVIAWIVASLARTGLRKLLEGAALDDKLSRIAGVQESEAPKRSTATIASDVAFYFILFLAIPPILGALGLHELGLPLRGVVDEVVLVVPNAVSAVALFGAGWLIARLVRSALSNLLDSVGVNDRAEKIGYQRAFKETRASDLIGAIAFWLIMIPVTIAAIEQLGLNSLTDPMRVVLVEVWGMVPNLFGAAVILVAALVGAKLVGGLIETLAETLGANSLLPRLGLGDLDARMKGKRTMSDVLGQIAAAVVLLFGVAEAFYAMELNAVGRLVDRLLNYLPEVGIAIAIIALGLFVGDFVRRLIEEQVKREEDRYLGRLAKIGVIVVAAVAASEEAGVASNFTLMAFTVALAATGLAAALAFGLGSREVAGEFVRKQVERSKEDEPPPAPPQP